MLLFIFRQAIFLVFALLISKHRMLLFITPDAYSTDLQAIFQNIVCYCLSKGRTWDGEAVADFKTSYVTVYHTGFGDGYFLNSFQNIVCYCLSFCSESSA